MNCINIETLSPDELKTIDSLKLKTICEFKELLSRIERGYKLEYRFILEEMDLILLLELHDLDYDLSIFVLQYYLNNPWQTTLY